MQITFSRRMMKSRSSRGTSDIHISSFVDQEFGDSILACAINLKNQYENNEMVKRCKLPL